MKMSKKPSKKQAPAPEASVAVLPKAPKKAKSAADPVRIDFPLEGEQVRPPHYSIRVAVEKGESPEISINGSQWQPCREAVGYYWFDWSPAEPGEIQVLARVKLGKAVRKSSPRTCVVALN